MIHDRYVTAAQPAGDPHDRGLELARNPKVWLITDHVCRLCLGRVLESAAGPNVYRCADCGAEGKAVGHEPGSGCACGMLTGGYDVGIRCTTNTNPRPEMPSEIIAKEVD